MSLGKPEVPSSTKRCMEDRMMELEVENSRLQRLVAELLLTASPIRDGFWLEFWAGNSGDTSTSNPAWAHPASNPVEMQKFIAEGETAYFAHKHTMAVSFVRHHPLLFPGFSLR